MPVDTSTNTSKEPDSNIDINTPYTPRRPSPIISISVNHPLAIAMRKIKNFLIHKQTLFSTTFTIKITPIVALVSFFGIAALFGGGITSAFHFGKTVEQQFLASVPTPTPKIIIKQQMVIPVSKSGTIKATYQNPPIIPSTTPNADGSPSAIPNSIPSPTVLHYILVSRSGSINFLTGPSTITFQKYLNLRVLITGNLDSTKNTLTIEKPEDIEVLQ